MPTPRSSPSAGLFYARDRAADEERGAGFGDSEDLAGASEGEAFEKMKLEREPGSPG